MAVRSSRRRHLRILKAHFEALDAEQRTCLESKDFEHYELDHLLEPISTEETQGFDAPAGTVTTNNDKHDETVPISKSMKQNPSKLSFFDLPPELRNEVYLYMAIITQEAKPKIYVCECVKSRCGFASPAKTSVLCNCCQIHHRHSHKAWPPYCIVLKTCKLVSKQITTEFLPIWAAVLPFTLPTIRVKFSPQSHQLAKAELGTKLHKFLRSIGELPSRNIRRIEQTIHVQTHGYAVINGADGDRAKWDQARLRSVTSTEIEGLLELCDNVHEELQLRITLKVESMILDAKFIFNRYFDLKQQITLSALAEPTRAWKCIWQGHGMQRG